MSTRWRAIWSRRSVVFRCAANWCRGRSGFEFEVLDADPRRVKKVRIHRGKSKPAKRSARISDGAVAGESPVVLPPRMPVASKARSSREHKRPLAHTSSCCPGAGVAPRSHSLAGALSVLALAPFNLWPILFLTFPVAVWLIDGSAAGRLGGISCGSDRRMVLSASAISSPASTGSAMPFWSTPRLSAGCCRLRSRLLPAGLAIFTAAGFALARLIWPRGAMRIIALAVALTGRGMAARPCAVAAFPGMPMAMRSPGRWFWRKAHRLFGLWGLTFLAVAIFASPATLADDCSDTRRRVAAACDRRSGARG